MQIAEKPQASLTVKALNITGVLWSDEFDTKAATSTGVNADNWSFQLGDGSAYGLVGVSPLNTVLHLPLKIVIAAGQIPWQKMHTWGRHVAQQRRRPVTSHMTGYHSRVGCLVYRLGQR